MQSPLHPVLLIPLQALTPRPRLLLAVPAGLLPRLLALASLHLRKGGFGLITTSSGTSKPGHRELEPESLKLPFGLVEVVDPK